jgi:hypothetical protein
MSPNHDETNRKLGINLRIDMLQHDLEENERSWIGSGLGMIHNTVAARLRREIAADELLMSNAG